MSDLWIGSGIWQGWRITTDHAMSSYGQPVLVDPDGNAYGPSDIKSDYLGLSEVADLLGWQKQRVIKYLSHPSGSFPRPLFRLASGPVWSREQIEQYKRQRDAE